MVNKKPKLLLAALLTLGLFVTPAAAQFNVTGSYNVSTVVMEGFDLNEQKDEYALAKNEGGIHIVHTENASQRTNFSWGSSPDNEVWDVAYREDGEQMASVKYFNDIGIFNTTDYNQDKTIATQTSYNTGNLDYSPDGKKLMNYEDGTTHFYNISSGNSLGSHNLGATATDVSYGNNYAVVSTTNEELAIYNTDDYSLNQTIQVVSSGFGVEGVSFMDGESKALVATEDGMFVYNTTDWTQETSFAVGTSFYKVDYTPDYIVGGTRSGTSNVFVYNKTDYSQIQSFDLQGTEESFFVDGFESKNAFVAASDRGNSYVLSAVTEPPVANFTLQEPNDGETFQLPSGQTDMNVDITASVEAQESGDVLLYANGNLENTFSHSGSGNETFTSSKNWTAGTYDYYWEYTDSSTGETVTSQNKTFTVTDKEWYLEEPAPQAEFLLPGGETDRQVNVTATLDSSQSGDVLFYADGNLEGTFSHSGSGNETFTSDKNWTSGGYDYYWEYTNPSTGEQFQSPTRTFYVTDLQFTLDIPQQNEILNTNDVLFEFSVNTNNLNPTVDLELDNNTIQTYNLNSGFNSLNHTETGVSLGQHNWSLTATDDAGVTYWSRQKQFTIEDSNVTFSNLQPAAGTTTDTNTQTTISVDVTADSSNSIDIEGIFDGNIETVCSHPGDGSTQTCSFTVTPGSPGSYNYYFNAITSSPDGDSLGTSDTRTLDVVDEEVLFTLQDPLDGATIEYNSSEGAADVQFNYTVDSTVDAEVDLVVDGNVEATDQILAGQSLGFSNNVSLAGGNYTWYVQATGNETGNTYDSLQRNFTVEEKATEISDWYDLNNTRNNPDGKYVLVNDLDKDTAGWADTAYALANNGNGWNPFPMNGNFDGNNHTIADLNIRRTETFNEDAGTTGLFTTVDGDVGNLNLKNFDIDAVRTAGTLAGEVTGSAVNVTSTNFTVTVENDRAGGISGRFYNGELESVVAEGSVKGQDEIGGVVGEGFANFGFETLNFAASYTDVQLVNDSVDAEYAGGIIGDANDLDITRSYHQGTVEADNSTSSAYLGGIAGNSQAEINDVYTSTQVSGGTDNDAIVGNYSNSLTDAYYNSDISNSLELSATGLNGSDMTGVDASSNMNFDFTNTWGEVVLGQNAAFNGYPIISGYQEQTQIDLQEQTSGEYNNFTLVSPKDGAVEYLGENETETQVPFTFALEADFNGTVELLVDGNVEATTTYNTTDGNQSYSASVNLSQGSHDWYVRATSDSTGQTYTSQTNTVNVQQFDGATFDLVRPTNYEPFTFVKGDTQSNVGIEANITANSTGDVLLYVNGGLEGTFSHSGSGEETFTSNKVYPAGTYEYYWQYTETETGDAFQYTSNNETFTVERETLFNLDQPSDGSTVNYLTTQSGADVNYNYTVDVPTAGDVLLYTDGTLQENDTVSGSGEWSFTAQETGKTNGTYNWTVKYESGDTNQTYSSSTNTYEVQEVQEIAPNVTIENPSEEYRLYPSGYNFPYNFTVEDSISENGNRELDVKAYIESVATGQTETVLNDTYQTGVVELPFEGNYTATNYSNKELDFRFVVETTSNNTNETYKSTKSFSFTDEPVIPQDSLRPELTDSGNPLQYKVQENGSLEFTASVGMYYPGNVSFEVKPQQSGTWTEFFNSSHQGNNNLQDYSYELDNGEALNFSTETTYEWRINTETVDTDDSTQAIPFDIIRNTPVEAVLKGIIGFFQGIGDIIENEVGEAGQVVIGTILLAAAVAFMSSYSKIAGTVMAPTMLLVNVLIGLYPAGLALAVATVVGAIGYFVIAGE